MSFSRYALTLLVAGALLLTGSVAAPAFATPAETPPDEIATEVASPEVVPGSHEEAPSTEGEPNSEPSEETEDVVPLLEGPASDAEPVPDAEADPPFPDGVVAELEANAGTSAAVGKRLAMSEKFSSNAPDTPEAAATAAAKTLSCAGQEYWMLPGCKYSSTFADPTVLPVQESGKTVYYAFGTTTSQLRLPVLKSTDLKTWKPATYSANTNWRTNNFNFNLRPWPKSKKYDDLEALHPNDYYNPRLDRRIPSEIRQFPFITKPPVGNTTAKFQREALTWYTVDGLVSPKPGWAADMGAKMGDRGWNRQENWAPGVAKIGATYFAYMSIRTRLPGAAGAAPDGAFCIAVATSNQPGGPYRYANGGNAVQCQSSDPGGAIDPEPVEYAGKWYLLWKGQGRGGVEQGLYAQPINTRTGALTGSRVTLLTRNMSAGTWEKGTIENPTMAKVGGSTYLVYSGGDYKSYGNNTSNYTTGYAVCPKGPTAPCHRPTGNNQLLKSRGKVQGPAGGSLFTLPNGDVKLAYHAYTLGGKPGVRNLRITNIYRTSAGRLVATTGAAPIFADVPANHKFAKQIKWLADRHITTGDKNGNFRPSGNVSRSDMAAFLYRYAGSPAYTPRGAEPFADVTKRTKFYKEIRWMHAQGLSTGVRNPHGGKPSYMPSSSISREAMAAFLYRLSGTKNYAPKGNQPLIDITPRSKFYKEIRWMYDNKITTGIRTANGVRYDERGTTKRDAFAAFLMRYDSKFGR